MLACVDEERVDFARSLGNMLLLADLNNSNFAWMEDIWT